ncbi:DUF1015 family protein [Streptomyces sp. ACA25]|uniref:DUF1015 family protein n=1 Tax=Streptomyces sp. ACA25 TaxID=3022596 RepID=UPI0023082804|nr:DUF1015 family protein [Streptomyces sp. ACA25]MDB1089485.1 DUF1015 family protein [Streptomyces sp. ACA25]
MLSDVLSPQALPSTPEPRTDLLIPHYILERRDPFDAVQQRGVIGSLDLQATQSGHVLRHQQVGESEVRLQTQLLRERGGSSDPLLLAAPDLGGFHECVRTATELQPDSVLETPEGGELRLWTADPRWTASPPALGPLLLAAGHHRLEAARRLHRTHQGPDGGRVPALVVDHARHPLTLSATHRALPGLDLARAVRSASRFARVRRRPRGSCPPPSRGSFLLTGEGQTWEVSAISGATMASRLRRLPSEWVELDAAVSDHVLIPALCEDQGILPKPRYLTDYPSTGEVGLILPSPTWNQVWAGAASGAGMPRKSTCVGPKPLPDLLARLA